MPLHQGVEGNEKTHKIVQRLSRRLGRMVLSSHRPGTVSGTSGVAHQDYLVPLRFAHKLLGIGKTTQGGCGCTREML